MISNEKALSIFLDMGRIMLENGSEVHKVEETIKHLGKAYGALHMDVFAITSSIVVTMKLQGDESVTQTRRIINNASNNFRRLEGMNQLSREYCSQKITIEELAEKLQKIKNEAVSSFKICLGGILAAGGLAVFFGGSIFDGSCSAILALGIYFLQKYFSKICRNVVVFNFISSLVIGLFAAIICHFIPILHADKIMIGDIMLLIPGLAMCNAIKDIFVGDTISGLMMLAETLLWAGAIALGFFLAVMIGQHF